ncbi:MAG: hypothetical protein KBD06_01495 [Candidatus Pacebacteria bacterium]|nr:hypothetical protein [Candidatus Paceibacterota bacterium]
MTYDKAKEDMKFAGHEIKDAAGAATDGVKSATSETEAELEEFAREDK